MQLRIRPRPSLIFISVIIVAHGGAAMLLFTAFPVWASLCLSCPIVISFVHVMTHHGLLSNTSSIKELIWNDANQWILITRDNKQYVSTLLPSSYCHAKVAVLNFRSKNNRSSIVLLADGVDKDIFRRLRVGLTIERAKLA